MSLRKLTAEGRKITWDYYESSDKQQNIWLSLFICFVIAFLELKSNPKRFSPDLDRAIKRVLNNEETSFLQVQEVFFTSWESYIKLYQYELYIICNIDDRRRINFHSRLSTDSQSYQCRRYSGFQP